MKRFIVIAIFAILLATIIKFEFALAGPTRVGNGDDGGDLEAGVPVRSGVLVETRDEALVLLKKLNIASVEGLGLLIPELERSEMLLLDRNIDLSKTNATPEARELALEEARAIGAVNEKQQLVYARTFAEPHASTRFFPAALKLERRQLVALHIHEALHRALPETVRENEKVVSRLTLAITSSDTSFDRVRDTAAKEIPRASLRAEGEAYSAGERSSTVEYGYQSYFRPDTSKSLSPVSSLHSLKSFTYPFGADVRLGVGLELTFVILPERSYLGPVGLSGRYRLGTWRSSDVDVFASLHLNTLSDGEIKNTPMGRDTGTVGVAMRRDETHFRLENALYFTPGSEIKRSDTGTELTHKYGSVFGARISAVAKVPASAGTSYELGGNGEILLANSHEVQGGTTSTSSGRLRVVTVGPELSYLTGDLKFTLSGRFVIDSTKGASLDEIGDLMGHGVGQGSWGAAVTWQF